jgi:hypothetical protein
MIRKSYYNKTRAQRGTNLFVGPMRRDYGDLVLAPNFEKLPKKSKR